MLLVSCPPHYDVPLICEPREKSPLLFKLLFVFCASTRKITNIEVFSNSTMLLSWSMLEVFLLWTSYFSRRCYLYYHLRGFGACCTHRNNVPQQWYCVQLTGLRWSQGSTEDATILGQGMLFIILRYQLLVKVWPSPLKTHTYYGFQGCHVPPVVRKS